MEGCSHTPSYFFTIHSSLFTSPTTTLAWFGMTESDGPTNWEFVEFPVIASQFAFLAWQSPG